MLPTPTRTAPSARVTITAIAGVAIIILDRIATITRIPTIAITGISTITIAITRIAIGAIVIIVIAPKHLL
jgi:hypothetical protein